MTRLTSELLDAAWQLIDGASCIAIVMHHNPDGDALGSAIALTAALKDLDKDARLVSPQEMPEVYDFLRPEEFVQTDFGQGVPDLAVLVDCDRAARAGAVEPLVVSARRVVVLDHHPDTSDFGDVRVCDQDCSATAEVLYRVLEHRGVKITRRIAEALLTGLITDTGGFRYPNTRPESMEMAAALVRAGVTTSEIAEKVYDTRSFAGIKLMARALSSIRLSPNGLVAWAVLTVEDYRETGAKPEDTEGFVNLVHGMRGVDVAMILREEKPGRVRVSFRSRGATPVNRAAEALGGGGHELAAACVMDCMLEEAEERVLDELRKWTEF